MNLYRTLDLKVNLKTVPIWRVSDPNVERFYSVSQNKSYDEPE